MNSGTARESGKLVSVSNPYVGPRAFRPGERLPNREREARELADLVIAERVVLLHSPSGAGKTSLIQSAVIRMLADDGFRSFGPARVDKPPPGEVNVRNRYVNSLALYLLGDRRTDPHQFESCTLEEVLSDATAATPQIEPQEVPVLMVDQFEEILTLDPTDWHQKEEFFEELGAVLAKGELWALLAIREDYMGGLERYRKLLPGHLRARYRLDFLTHDEAKLAIQQPAEDRDVQFRDAAAQALIDQLAKTKVSSPDQTCEWQEAPYVEPFQLQVVCHTLWGSVSSAKHDHFHAIELDDVEKVDINHALSRFYGDSVADAAERTKVPERTIRDWFENQLVTPQKFRGQTAARPVLGEEGAQALRLLEDAHLIRVDTRAQTTWYELEHDRLITAVLNNNELWRWANLEPWQRAAHEWQRNGRPRELLLAPHDIPRFGPHITEQLTVEERAFRKASLEEARREGLMAGARSAVSLLSVIALVEAVVIVILLVLWI
ncbi:hypothetical protein [Kitasatospora sp. NPDC085879]|uniref:nSTAND1 domain-containing NTPase n=1 Tax=Kitasatospora sp. NPDC085879 TaxID=3154769 RepID=UPI003427233E